MVLPHQLQWFLCVLSCHFISFTHESRVPRVHLASPDLLEEAMLLGLEMGLARDSESRGHEIYKKANSAAAGALWFGPRLGRKKRSLDEEDEKFEERVNELEDEQEGEEGLRDLLRTSPWAIIPLRNKASITYRSTANFTPRPGRSLSDEDDYSGSRSPPFAPRLGRPDHSALWRITPRPGRQDPRIRRSVT